MKSESNLVFEIWDLVRDSIPAARRNDVAITILRHFEEYGFQSEDLEDILDEDDHLTVAFRMVFGNEADDDIAETDFDDHEEL